MLVRRRVAVNLASTVLLQRRLTPHNAVPTDTRCVRPSVRCCAYRQPSIPAARRRRELEVRLELHLDSAELLITLGAPDRPASPDSMSLSNIHDIRSLTCDRPGRLRSATEMPNKGPSVV